MSDQKYVPSKPYSQEEYDMWDQLAKDAVEEHLNVEGVYTIVVPRRRKDDYGVDIRASSHLKNHMSYLTVHEVEVKVAWKNGLIPYVDTELRIPARKRKIFEDNPNVTIYFWIVSTDGLGAFRIAGHCVNREERVIQLKDREDTFFINPIEDWEYVQLRKFPEEEKKHGNKDGKD